MPETSESRSHFEPISIKETLTSVMIAFIMAFVFRGFVIEGFLIPTGSMAPTLLGKHMRFQGPDTGYDFAVGPWDYADRGNQIPTSIQGPGTAARPEQRGGPIEPTDPVTGQQWEQTKVPLRAGDRVFVIKYLPVLFEPERWDVTVFKNPGTQENYIKRLIGLPNEQIALAAGDVFTRPFSAIVGEPRGADAWDQSGWSIQRKPERVQRAMFQLLFDSVYTPPTSTSPGSTYRAPWRGEGDWEGIDASITYRKNGSGAATLAWRDAARPVTDWVAYNESRTKTTEEFPATDVAMSFGIQPDEGAQPITITAVLNAMGFEYRGEYDAGAGRVTLRMRPQDAGPDEPWDVIVDNAEAPALETGGAATTIEFWHMDQALSFYIDGRLVAGGRVDGAYELTPAERMRAATGSDLDELLTRFPQLTRSVLGSPETYRPTTLRWEFGGGPFTLHRVALKRDIYYQHHPVSATRGAHPSLPVVLNDTQYFMCGDNSPSSLDSRLWSATPGGGAPDPWVAEQVDPTIGVVHEDLLIGKAFVVYFPAPLRETRVPIPDVGRMRWIW